MATIDWQPIDTVPRDGTEVLLFEPHDPEDFTAGGYYWSDFWDEDAPGGPNWDNASDSNPSHWATLPDGPAQP